MFIAPFQVPDRLAGVAEHNGVVIDNVFHPFRCAMAGDILRRSPENLWRLAELFRHEARVPQLTEPERNIHALCHKVRDRIVGHEVKPDTWESRQETRHRRRHNPSRKRVRT
jgi:hypothetical protein